MSVFIERKKGASITVAASDKLAVFSKSAFKVIQVTAGSPNIPSGKLLLANQSGSYLSSAFSAASVVKIQAGDSPLFYATGTAPVVMEQYNIDAPQPAPGALNATGTLTAALIEGGIVTSTTGSAVTATLDTGAVMDSTSFDASAEALNQGFFWSVINTGGNAFTVTASSGHTIVGVAAVATVTSGRFLTRRSAAATWITYRIS